MSGKKRTRPATRNWADSSCRFALDELFRKHGYRIHSRQPGREPTWIKDGETYSETEVMSQLPFDEVEDAAYMQDLYYEGYC